MDEHIAAIAEARARGEQLAARRSQVGITQAELASRLSVRRETVGRWEAGLVPVGTLMFRTALHAIEEMAHERRAELAGVIAELEALRARDAA